MFEFHLPVVVDWNLQLQFSQELIQFTFLFAQYLREDLVNRIEDESHEGPATSLFLFPAELLAFFIVKHFFPQQVPGLEVGKVLVEVLVVYLLERKQEVILAAAEEGSIQNVFLDLLQVAYRLMQFQVAVLWTNPHFHYKSIYFVHHQNES